MSNVDTNQIGGKHYVLSTVQPWAAMEAWMTAEQFEGYLRGNVIKYIARYPKKAGLEDLKKAEHYLQKLLQVKVQAFNDQLPLDLGDFK